MKKLVLIVTLVIVSFSFLSADVYIKQQAKTGMQGQPEKISYTETWLTKNKLATVMEGKIAIINMDTKMMYLISPATKSYVESSLPVDMSKLMPAQMVQMMKGMMASMEVSIVPNGQTKKILNIDAKGYLVTTKVMGMETKMTLWASSNLPFDWKSYSMMFLELTKAMQSNLGDKFIKEYMKIDGITLGMEMSMMGANMATTTVEINPNKTAPANIYTVPAGFTKKTQLDMPMMQK